MGNQAASDTNLAQFGMNRPGNYVHESGLARPIFPEDGVNLSGKELDAHVAKRWDS